MGCSESKEVHGDGHAQLGALMAAMSANKTNGNVSSTNPRATTGNLQQAMSMLAKTTVDANGNMSSTDPKLNRQYHPWYAASVR